MNTATSTTFTGVETNRLGGTTAQSLTTAKGVTIHLGDIVKAKGSKIEREVLCIFPDISAHIWAGRTDGVLISKKAGLDENKVVIVRSVTK